MGGALDPATLGPSLSLHWPELALVWSCPAPSLAGSFPDPALA